MGSLRATNPKRNKMKLSVFNILFLTAEANKKDQVTKRVDKLEDLWNQNMALSGLSQRRVDTFDGHFSRFAAEAKDFYKRQRDQKGCNFPSHWKGDDDEDDDLRFLFDSKNPCQGVKQFTNQLLDWANVFCVQCRKADEKDPRPWLGRFETNISRFANRVLAKMNEDRPELECPVYIYL